MFTTGVIWCQSLGRSEQYALSLIFSMTLNGPRPTGSTLRSNVLEPNVNFKTQVTWTARKRGKAMLVSVALVPLGCTLQQSPGIFQRIGKTFDEIGS